MDIVASLFDSKSRCFCCKKVFKLTSKRRKCIVCSNFHSEYIFCKDCSIKVTKSGLFSNRRYCNDCYHETSTNFLNREAVLIPAVVSLEEAAINLGITQEELLSHKEEVKEVINTMNNGVKCLRTNSSVGFI